MNVDLCRPSDIAAEAVDVAVVIDVFRATTTAAVICERFGAVRLLAHARDLIDMPRSKEEVVVFSELVDLPVGYRQVDNSPTTASTIELGAATPVLISTNGTRVVGRCTTANTIVLASLVNFSACAAYLRSTGPESVRIIPAGSVARNESAIEDDLCAESLRKALVGESIDLNAVVEHIYEDSVVQQRLVDEPGLNVDVDFSLQSDIVNVVPVITSISTSKWYDAEAVPEATK